MKVVRKKESLASQVLESNLLDIGRLISVWCNDTKYDLSRVLMECLETDNDDFGFVFQCGTRAGNWGDWIVCEPTHIEIYTEEQFNNLFDEKAK